MRLLTVVIEASCRAVSFLEKCSSTMAMMVMIEMESNPSRLLRLVSTVISKDYAEDLFRLLAAYNSISSSEAASRLNLHIKTVQDFMEVMAELGILEKAEVYEKKRPYFRYSLKMKKITMELDLGSLIPT